MTHEAREPFHESAVFTNVEVFSQGKNPPKNEDLAGFNDTTLVLSDGATDKTGLDFEGRTGGELAAEVVVETCLRSGAHGEALVAEVTSSLSDLYARINPNAMTDSAYRFAATMVVAKIIGDQVIITQVGDSSFRINGTDEYKNDKTVDTITALTRKAYIDGTGDIAGSRDYIMPLLKSQHQYQNNGEHPLGYGVIDGTTVPSKFIRTFTFPVHQVHSLEIVSDGYFGVFPDTQTIEGYEGVHRMIEQVDPNKCGFYPSTKLSDDRTALIAQISS